MLGLMLFLLANLFIIRGRAGYVTFAVVSPLVVYNLCKGRHLLVGFLLYLLLISLMGLSPFVQERLALARQACKEGDFLTTELLLGPSGIEGVFEHHTGLIDRPKLEGLLRLLADGSLQHDDVFGDHGHGALIYADQPLVLGEGGFDVAVTGPRRNLFRETADRSVASDGDPWRSYGSSRPTTANAPLIPYFAVPFGDMMIAGCFGLLAATADVLPELGEPVRASLAGAGGSGTPPWEIT